MSLGPWAELLEASREFHLLRSHACSTGCRLGRALEAFPEIPSLFDPVIDPPSLPPLSDPDADEVGSARRSDPDTSKKAAHDSMPGQGTQKRAVLDFAFGSEKGIACFDVRFWARDLEESASAKVRALREHQTASRRITDLCEGGWLEDSGERRLSPISGREQIVWVVTERGRRELAGELVPA